MTDCTDMEMKALIENFGLQIVEGMEIFAASTPKAVMGKYANVVISGLGGSGIGGTIIKDMSSPYAYAPVIVNKEYSVPSFIGSETLFIASSYSGDTEETLAATEDALKRNATIICITSGGKLLKLAKENNLDYLLIPGGHPPRACLGYSLTQLICIFSASGLLPASFSGQLAEATRFLASEADDIRKKAMEIARTVHGKRVIIYCDASHEGVAVRFRQQLNENSKMLCWHHVIPEMNHNELVGWTREADDHAVFFLRNLTDHPRNQHRFEINKEIVQKYKPAMVELWSEGKNELERVLYMIHLGDWISFYLSELNEVDIMDIKVIDYLKSQLSRID